jgi:glycosyltransferase involved in cell wall biosynthesis
MKIALVNQPWDTIIPPVQAGSIPIWNYEVARRLVRSSQVIIYSRKNRGQQSIEISENVEYRRVSIAGNRWFNALSKSISQLNRKSLYFASSLYGFSYALMVALDLRKQGCDLVHIPNFSQFVPIIRAFNPKIKIVLHMHCEWLNQLDYNLLTKRLAKVDLIIGCSDYITEKIKHRFPQFAARCQTVFNGVDIQVFNPTDRTHKTEQKIIYVGRISPEKGLHILLDAFALVRAKYPSVKLEIIGPQKPTPIEFLASLSDDPKVIKLAQFIPEYYFSDLQNKLPGKDAGVSFIGAVNHLELANCYREADILINPSLSEAFGMSLVEAMAVGIPAIATKIGGMTEVIEDNLTGLLVQADNPAALAEAIMKLLADEELRKAMGILGRQRVLEFFCWQKVTDNLCCNYTKLLGDREIITSDRVILAN